VNRSRKTLSSSAFALVLALGAALLIGAPTGAAATASPEIAMTHDGTGESIGPFAVPRYRPSGSGGAVGSGWDACLVGELCLFMDVDGKGNLYYWTANQFTADFRNLPCPEAPATTECYHPVIGTFDNEASSWRNRTSQEFCVSDGYFGGDPDNTMPAGTQGNFTTTNWNDRASSLGYLNCPK
jgi:hypothetical protein